MPLNGQTQQYRTVDWFKAQTSLTRLFFEQVARFPDKPFLWEKSDGAWRERTYGAAAKDILALAGKLRALGVSKRDRVCLVGDNSPRWTIADIAIMATGGVAVPTYTTNTVKDNLHILSDSGSKGVIISSVGIAKRMLPAAAEHKGTEFVIAMDPAILELPEAEPLKGRMMTWDQAIAEGSGSQDAIMETVASTTRNDLAVLIYTSGTGGVPKGVMLHHGAILFNLVGAHELLLQLGLDDEVFLSFLPLSHAYEHTAGLWFPVSVGAQIYYAESVESLVSNMAEVQPTIMSAVPRLYETMQRRILQGVAKAGGTKEKLFLKAIALGRQRYENPASMNLLDRTTDKLLDRLVRRKVSERFGGRLKAFVSGGGALNYEVGVFFISLGLRVLQGYGQTESAPLISCNPPDRVKIHTVGPAVHGVDVRIADDGEILVRGELVMKGYWNQPDYTARTIRDGWLHTGDIGLLDEDGYIQITDRKKDIIVLSGGDNVSPQRVEGFLTLQPEIGQAMVYGDHKAHLVALIVPDAEWLRAWCKDNGKSPDDEGLADDPALREVIQSVIGRVNTDLSLLERVKKFRLAAEPFSVENGMMTPTLKIRRHVIKQNYGQSLEALY